MVNWYLKNHLIVCKKISSVITYFLNGSCEKIILSNLSKIFVCPLGINNLNLQIEIRNRWSNSTECFLLLVSQSLSHLWLFVTPWTAERQASLSFTISRSLLKFMSIESVMPSKHLILCLPLLLLPSMFPSIRVFCNELPLRMRWPKCWEFQLQHESFQWIFRTDFF